VFKDGHILEDTLRQVQGERDEQKKRGQIPIQDDHLSEAGNTNTKLGSDPISFAVAEGTTL
jgi:hypothetical protein